MHKVSKWLLNRKQPKIKMYNALKGHKGFQGNSERIKTSFTLAYVTAHMLTIRQTVNNDSVQQCFSILVLKAPRPACFPCFPAPAHLIQMNESSSAFCRA